MDFPSHAIWHDTARVLASVDALLSSTTVSAQEPFPLKSVTIGMVSSTSDGNMHQLSRFRDEPQSYLAPPTGYAPQQGGYDVHRLPYAPRLVASTSNNIEAHRRHASTMTWEVPRRYRDIDVQVEKTLEDIVASSRPSTTSNTTQTLLSCTPTTCSRCWCGAQSFEDMTAKKQHVANVQTDSMKVVSVATDPIPCKSAASSTVDDLGDVVHAQSVTTYMMQPLCTWMDQLEQDVAQRIGRLTLLTSRLQRSADLVLRQLREVARKAAAEDMTTQQRVDDMKQENSGLRRDLATSAEHIVRLEESIETLVRQRAAEVDASHHQFPRYTADASHHQFPRFSADASHRATMPEFTLLQDLLRHMIASPSSSGRQKRRVHTATSSRMRRGGRRSLTASCGTTTSEEGSHVDTIEETSAEDLGLLSEKRRRGNAKIGKPVRVGGSAKHRQPRDASKKPPLVPRTTSGRSPSSSTHTAGSSPAAPLLAAAVTPVHNSRGGVPLLPLARLQSPEPSNATLHELSALLVECDRILGGSEEGD